ncbi:MAG TPA: helix-turn-helix domain-containing protein [Chlorobaculum parvum]|uniref:Methyltransferase n=1 Tax=Chlorobaculum parvum TaxID=274539 RepID=A0A7C5HDZ4_9CHLB|nr:helix-turn-helix domain-containing protein [Chlorobaculum parvum]
MSKLYTTEEAATYLGVSSARIRQFIQEDRLVSEKSGRDHLIQESILAEFALRGRKKTGRPLNGKAPVHENGSASVHCQGLRILHGDTRDIIRTLPDNTFRCVVTSPPYWGVRDYGIENQIGAEPDLNEYINALVKIFSEVRRVLKPDGTFWLNIGNTYTSGGRKWRQDDAKNKGRAMSYRPPTPKGLKKKDLIGVAWMVAMACQLDGWYLRNDIIWHKPNCQPESVKDRLTVAHEYLFMFSKSERYFFNQDAIKESFKNGSGLKNKRTVWSINTEPCAEAHFAIFPKNLVKPCILAGTEEGDMVLDPFYGAGTVGIVSQELNRKCVGIEINTEYIDIARKRNQRVQGKLMLQES